ncbi:hypothetical protein [Mycolicibacterium fortuitum]|uniref:hypothetical protein n=1 Tax=Mycolicibacterium fortuitum TaxID=1766 RepID=UPI0027DAE09D|nr:hypothetical protein [Mycolicibacterium fortuitum]
MTAPAQCIDPATEVVAVAMGELRALFDPAGPCPPEGTGTTTVRFFASDGGLPFWDGMCKEPFLWVRVQQRYRSTTASFPNAFVADNSCGSGSIRVLALELGVARCSSHEAKPTWSKLEKEAQVSLDDSWRIENALCRIVRKLRSKSRAVGTDSIAPTGPEGGVMAWTGVVYVQF